MASTACVELVSATDMPHLYVVLRNCWDSADKFGAERSVQAHFPWFGVTFVTARAALRCNYESYRGEKESFMVITSETPVRDIAVAVPAAIPAFERLGLDYCCHGQHTLAEACTKGNISLSGVLDELNNLQGKTSESAPESKWLHASFKDLTEHIVKKHHAFTREHLDLIGGLMAKVENRHGAEHPEVFQVGKMVAVMDSELRHHSECEEANLFPYIAAMETKARPDLPAPAKGSVKMPISRMMGDHDQTGEELAKLRKITNNYVPPASACPTWHALYRAMEELDADLHTHIHLENNILFPRALKQAEEESKAVAAA